MSIKYVTTHGIESLDIIKLSEFLRRSFNDPIFSAAYIDWLYNQCPTGKAVCITAFDEKKIVGHLAAIPREYKYKKNSNIKGLLALNAVVEKAYIKYGVFAKLILGLNNEMKEMNLDFIIGIPNKNALNGWIKRGKAHYLGKLEIYFSLFKTLRPAQRVLEYNLNSQLKEWFVRDPSHRRQINDEIICSRIKFIPMKFFSICSFFKNSKSNSSNFISLITGYVSSQKPLGPAIRLPDLLKPVPFHIILISQNPEVISFFKSADIQAKDFDAI